MEWVQRPTKGIDYLSFYEDMRLTFIYKAASRSAAYDVGFIPSSRASQTKPKFIYLLNADEVDPKTIPQNAFVVYQGHHGDFGAPLADVCLPATAYTEKGATWVNAEGRSQMGRTAVSPPGAAREDWKIIRYVLLPSPRVPFFASSINSYFFFFQCLV